MDKFWDSKESLKKSRKKQEQFDKAIEKLQERIKISSQKKFKKGRNKLLKKYYDLPI